MCCDASGGERRFAEAVRRRGEVIDREFGSAKGGSRAVGMREGAAIQAAVYYERVVSGGGWWGVL